MPLLNSYKNCLRDHNNTTPRKKTTFRSSFCLAQTAQSEKVTVNNSPTQDYFFPDDHTQPTYEKIPEFKSSEKSFLLQSQE